MLASARGRCTVLLMTLLMMSAAGMAASLDFSNDNVWLVDSEPDHIEATASCSMSGTTTKVIRAGSTNVSVGTDVTRKDVRDLGLEPGINTIELYCANSTANTTAEDTVTLREPSFAITEPGAGFVGNRLDDSAQQTPLTLDIDVNGEVPEKDQLAFRFASRDGRFAWSSGDPWRLTNDGDVIIRPTLNAYIPDDDFVTLHLNVTAGNETISYEEDFTPQTYDYDPEIVSSTVTPEIEFPALLENSYLYSINQGLEQRSSADDLKSGDVALTVEEVDGSDAWTDRTSWIDFSYTGSDSDRDGEIVIGLNNRPPIPKGRFDFSVEILRPDKDIVIDRFRVINEDQVSGIIKQPGRGGIVTNMFLKYSDSTERVINTDSDGRYSFPLGKPVQYTELSFFQRQLAQPEGELTVNSPDFSTEADTNYETIKFEYYENPSVGQRGLNPINMMAVKFGYHIDGEVSASMKLDTTNVNLEELNMYECQQWNMLGEQCQGTWTQVDEDEFAYDPINNRVNIHDVELREVEDGEDGTSEIVKHGYVAGVPAELRLQGDTPLTINSQEITAGGRLEVSGTVISTKNGGIDDAQVELTLHGEDAEKTYTAESSSNGRFTIEGDAPEEPGDYSVDVRLEKDPFVPYTLTSEQSIEVYYDTGMLIDASSFSQITMGNESTLAFEIENTGQAPIDISDVSIQGMNGYAALASQPSVVDAGESAEAEVLVTLPEDFCSYPCSQTPELDIAVEGESAGTQLSAETTISTSIPVDRPDQAETESTEPQNTTEENQSSFMGPTANFIQSQSDMNIALGMILIFTVVLAAAIKRKKNQQDTEPRDSQVSGGNGQQQARPQFEPRESKISRPKVSASDQDEDRPSADEEQSGEDAEDTEPEPNEDGKYVCEATGETFDTKAALKMYKKMNDIE